MRDLMAIVDKALRKAKDQYNTPDGETALRVLVRLLHDNCLDVVVLDERQTRTERVVDVYDKNDALYLENEKLRNEICILEGQLKATKPAVTKKKSAAADADRRGRSNAKAPATTATKLRPMYENIIRILGDADAPTSLQQVVKTYAERFDPDAIMKTVDSSFYELGNPNKVSPVMTIKQRKGYYVLSPEGRAVYEAAQLAA